ncbi:uncharacterized protein LACBIDRAFT_318401 [Laccaria bicolor S238N-H82]|uniref:Predicted protein n=1 Tax=Laccaria bicolor (strain S238N-H82 / ATCC MYA-4686) TaxID=486041 RepID=B0D6N5_LACBS|nr:uncharacterized protein LACBIDRAFT_318401 [Laccaria bicolor S238N-H82]EDR10218.1 predicted protein [Laccaria bicolor S238N-H82]|eukprot:XP_001879603.1 predicted protein [Laccaria bicolor S238N-H82]
MAAVFVIVIHCTAITVRILSAASWNRRSSSGELGLSKNFSGSHIDPIISPFLI